MQQELELADGLGGRVGVRPDASALDVSLVAERLRRPQLQRASPPPCVVSGTGALGASSGHDRARPTEQRGRHAGTHGGEGRDRLTGCT
eukprot:COSAG01_NODE_10154_length_2235_cov_4.282776_3_plen_89_part_00